MKNDLYEVYKEFKPILMTEISRILDEFKYSDGVVIKIDLNNDSVPSISYSVNNKYAFFDIKESEDRK